MNIKLLLCQNGILKKKIDGTIERLEERLVAKGFTQKEDLDYFDTYALVARDTTIRVLIASVYHFEIHQMEVKTTSLNEELDEQIYVKQPDEFIMQDKNIKFVI